MGEDKILDSSDHALEMSSPFTKRDRIGFLSVLALYSALFFASCSIPRIIVLKDPLTAEEHLNLGVAYETRGELDFAIKEYQSAAKKLPIALLYLGNVHFQREDWDAAEAYYKKAIKKDPGNGDSYNNLAWLYYTKGENLDEAEDLALKAISLNPAKSPIYRDSLEKIREKKRSGP
jgi:tetratricopeptide (TPR) repeat protein